MARYKHIDTSPRLLPVVLEKQLLPGTFEFALHHLIGRELDLRHLDARFKNDLVGAPAYPPAMLLKVVLFAYSQGIVSSRAIEAACREHVTFIALCGDQAPHWTTIARFVSTLGADIAQIFGAVLAICDRQGLIGKQMFAIDGVKLPSNASKAKSGTRAEFALQADKMEQAAQQMLVRHREQDRRSIEPELLAKEQRRIEQLHTDASQLRQWLEDHPQDRRGPPRGKRQGALRKSNRTDADSAKMATSKGVIQGYSAVAAVDAKAQIVVAAQAHGSGNEQELLVPIVDAMAGSLQADSLVLTDSGFHSEDNLKQLAARSIDALIADNGMRKRDERFAQQGRHRAKPDPLWNKAPKPIRAQRFAPKDFFYDEQAKVCICPAGEFLYQNGADVIIAGRHGVKFKGAQRICGPCPIREQCLRHPARTQVRQVVFFTGQNDTPNKHSERMRERIDTEQGRALYAKRLGIVEPVFGNLRYNKGLDRFTLRGRDKVDGQWQLFCLVHNIEKLARHGYGQ